jgi:uncharacterized protein
MHICAYTSGCVSFRWDPAKARTNRAKHKISFADAIGAFEDPYAVTIEDPHEGEDRYVTIGLDFLGRLVVVCWTSREDHIRVISARRALRRERDQYESET